MALFGAAMQSGMSSLQLLATGSNAQTDAMYNAQYAATIARVNAANHKVAAEGKIAAVKQDKILSNTNIQMQQSQAEAYARVNAAAAGTAGTSVEDSIYATENNAARQVGGVNQRAEQQIENAKAQVYTAESAMNSVVEPEASYAGDLMSAFSNVTLDDIRTGVAMLPEDDMQVPVQSDAERYVRSWRP